MAGGISTTSFTFNQPNFHGELYNITPADTRFLSAIGGLNGGEATMSTLFQWTEYDLRDRAQNASLEGADAPDPTARVRGNVFNVVQVLHETVSTSYTKQAAVGQFADTGSNHPHAAGVGAFNAVADEHGWQTAQVLKQMACDVNWVFINGTFQEPADNATPRQTRGILEAITTNVIDHQDGGVDQALTEAVVLDLLQQVWENGGITESETATIMVNAWQKRMLTQLFVSDAIYRQDSRTLGGRSVDTVITDFGELNILLERDMPAGQLAVVSMEELNPVHLLIPNKGFLFIEELGKAGSREEDQIYGEVGLKYGNERKHGKITGLTTAAA